MVIGNIATDVLDVVILVIDDKILMISELAWLDISTSKASLFPDIEKIIKKNTEVMTDIY